MSALALIAGRLAPGVWQADDTALGDVASLASGFGWTVRSGAIVADDKSGYLQQLATIAETPSYVRPNWDSVADGLRDLAFEQQCLLLIERSQPSPFDSTAMEILNEAATFWEKQSSVLQVIWFGACDAPALAAIDPTRASRFGRGARTGKTPGQ